MKTKLAFAFTLFILFGCVSNQYTSEKVEKNTSIELNKTNNLTLENITQIEVKIPKNETFASIKFKLELEKLRYAINANYKNTTFSPSNELFYDRLDRMQSSIDSLQSEGYDVSVERFVLEACKQRSEAALVRISTSRLMNQNPSVSEMIEALRNESIKANQTYLFLVDLKQNQSISVLEEAYFVYDYDIDENIDFWHNNVLTSTEALDVLIPNAAIELSNEKIEIIEKLKVRAIEVSKSADNAKKLFDPLECDLEEFQALKELSRDYNEFQSTYDEYSQKFSMENSISQLYNYLSDAKEYTFQIYYQACGITIE